MLFQSAYDPEIAREILERLEQGESLIGICKSDPKFPHERTVRRWAADDIEGFAPKYARARDVGLDAIAEQVIAIADDSSNDWITRTREDGSEYEVLNSDHVNRSRLRFDARRWYLSKLAPKKYGERQAVEHTGKDGEPLTLTVRSVLDRDKS